MTLRESDDAGLRRFISELDAKLHQGQSIAPRSRLAAIQDVSEDAESNVVTSLDGAFSKVVHRIAKAGR